MRRPLIYLLIALIIGIIAGSHFAVSYYLLLAVITLILFFLVVTIRKQWFPITGMDPKASFGVHTLCFAGLFNLPIPLRYVFGI